MLPKAIRQRVVHHEVLMAFILVWLWLPVICSLAGFYLGTWLFSQHTLDLQGPDIDKGGIGALVGLGISIAIAIGVTALYPKKIAKEYEVREASWRGEGHGEH